jgi:zinc transport system ATP-binding protein
MSQITVSNLTLAYDGVVIADRLNFCVNKGDYLCIVGENGSGKTTLIKSLLGLKKQAQGSITFGDGVRKNAVGYLPQQTEVQMDFPVSVKEVVMSGFVGKRKIFFGKAEEKEANKNMHLLGIGGLATKCYRELSGGQQQRVLLARALCATKSVLLLDEPVTGLDPKATADMYDLIETLNRSGLTVIMISHDVNAVVGRASHILHLAHGSNFYGTSAEYLASAIGSEFLKGGAR